MTYNIPFLSNTAPDTPQQVKVEDDAESAIVRVSWHMVDNADRYIVTFSKVEGTGQQGVCPTDSHTASLTVDGGSSTSDSIDVGRDVESTDLLRAYTTYEVTVTAVGDRKGTSQPSTAQKVTTSQTSETHRGL